MNKKQPKARTKNPIGLWLGGAMIIIGILAVVNGVTSLTDNKTVLAAPGGAIQVEIADTNESRYKGLSDRATLPVNEGMLFVFEESTSSNCFVMRDTLVDLDMVWLNESKSVVTIATDVKPESYPAESFCPSEPAKYGLEIAAGQANELAIEIGKELRF